MITHPNIAPQKKSRSRFASFTTAVGILVAFGSIHVNADEAHAECSHPVDSAAHLYELNHIALGESAFLQGLTVNREYLLALDPDRLLAPFLQEAGLEPKKPTYGNWESGGLGGHTAGHYLSALALMVEAGGDDADATLQSRLNYMIDELQRCQEAAGNGYIGGVPNGQELWKEVASGKIEAHGFGVNNRWVPWYNLHKTFAGLRDVYQYTGNETSLTLLKGLGDWCVALFSQLSDEQVQSMLRSEHGGMNEVMADFYAITGDERYLEVAERFCHHAVLDPLMDHKDELTGMHANTQIPKVIGLARIASLTGDSAALDGAKFFWETVTQHRSVAFGGNSVREHFNDPSDFKEVLESRQGPETCNTYNMLRLTEQLFMAEPEAKYADYYERALYNHILASIHPEIPGYVYFTPLRPDHYRVYSQPENCFWCCVGSGMENPGKYGEFIFAEGKKGEVFVNLFIPSTLEMDHGGKLHQKTQFPNKSGTELTFELSKSTSMELKVRHPGWVAKDALKIRVNGEVLEVSSDPSSYVSIKRTWKNGDTVDVEFPMELHAERLPDDSDWVALMAGPILLAAPKGTENLDGLRADDSRMGHVASGPLVSLNEVPVLLKQDKALPQFIHQKTDEDSLTYQISKDAFASDTEGMTLKPFYQVHDQRYQMYWEYLTKSELEERIAISAAEEAERKMREAATLDRVAIGEQQSEVEHGFQATQSETGIFDGKRWRHGKAFQYTLDSRGETEAVLELTFWGGDQGRIFNILVNGTVIATRENTPEQEAVFYRKQYPLSADLLNQGKDGLVEVRFEAVQELAGGIFDVRLLKADSQAVSATGANPSLASNPFLWADVPDISIVRVEDTYYMSSTTMHMNPGLPIMKSKDLVNWELASYAYDELVDNEKMRLENGANAYGAGSWASSIRYHDDWLYVSTFSSTSGKTHVYRTQDPDNGPWEAYEFEPKLHDHSLWFEDDGSVYMIYGGGKINMVELNPEAKGVKAGAEHEVIIADASKVAGDDIMLNAEGSQLFKVDGKYYLFHITWPRNDMRTVIIHRADDLRGPWEGRVALKDRGIAQGGLIDTPDGKWYAYLFQDHGAVGRSPFLVPVTWEAGWPVLGIDGKVPMQLDIPISECSLKGIVTADEFERSNGNESLPLAWQWNHNPVKAYWSLNERSGYLRLKTFGKDDNVLQSRNMLTQRTFGPTSSAEVALEFDEMKDGDRAGLIALQKFYGWVGLKKDAGNTFLVVEQVNSEGASEVTEKIALEDSVNRVCLRISCDFRGEWPSFTDQAEFSYSLDGEKWHSVGKSLQMRYTLPHFMGYRFGLFNYATSETGGYVDFDYYRISE